MEEKREKLEEIARQIAECKRCKLYKQAVQAVPGQGNPEARVVLVGEGPGYWEDQKGIPFCGPSGHLLDKLFSLIGLKRDQVWIGNMVKHRPPNNRDPLAEEIEACQPFLDAQIKIINPEIIVTLGRFAMNRFLPGEYISKIHGQARFVEFAGQKRIVIPIYHPAAALRNGQMMAAIQEDFKKIGQFLAEGWKEGEEKNEQKEEKKQLSLIE